MHGITYALTGLNLILITLIYQNQVVMEPVPITQALAKSRLLEITITIKLVTSTVPQP